MENMKTLADQIREELVNPGTRKVKPAAQKNGGNVKRKQSQPGIITELNAFDTTGHKSMVHVRFDEKTVRTMNQFKMATGIDVTKFVSFAVLQLMDNRPEIKTIIKQFIQNADL